MTYIDHEDWNFEDTLYIVTNGVRKLVPEATAEKLLNRCDCSHCTGDYNSDKGRISSTKVMRKLYLENEVEIQYNSDILMAILNNDLETVVKGIMSGCDLSLNNHEAINIAIRKGYICILEVIYRNYFHNGDNFEIWPTNLNTKIFNQFLTKSEMAMCQSLTPIMEN